MSFGLAPTKTVFPGWGRVLWGEVPGASFLMLLCNSSVPRVPKLKVSNFLNFQCPLVKFPHSKKGEIHRKFPWEISRTFQKFHVRNFQKFQRVEISQRYFSYEVPLTRNKTL